MKRIGLGCLLALGFLVGCSRGVAPRVLDPLVANPLAGIDWLAINAGIAGEYSRFNCAANEFNVPGQGFRVQGSDGGLTYALSETQTTGRTDARAVGKGWNGVGKLLGVPQRDVKVFVVDDFRGDAWGNNVVYKPSPELFLQANLNPATLGTLQQQNKLSHGALVLQHTKDAVRGTGRYPLVSAPLPDTTLYQTLGMLPKKLTVQAVNTKFASTGVIAGSATSAVIAQTLTTKLLTSVAPHIINLSFALLPCEAYADYRAYDKKKPEDVTFQLYLKALAVKNGMGYDAIASLIVEAVNDPNDPLYKLLINPAQGVKRNIFVAAAGNYGFSTPMYPAKWPGVVDVTGSKVLNKSVRDVKRFNRGEIMDVAASLELDASRFTRNPRAKDVYYLGTSFSTPTLSVYSALDAAGQQRCITANAALPKSKLARNVQGLVDAPLTKAVTQLCPIP